MRRVVPPHVWFAAYVVALTCALLGSALYLATCAARAGTELPGGVTCEQVAQYAATLGIPDTRLGRAQARLIALTFGVVLTSAQLDEAARCLRQRRQDREDR